MMFDRLHGIGCIHLMVALALALPAFGLTARAGEPDRIQPRVVPYGGPHFGPVSQAFSVKVNGQPVFTHSFMSYDYAHFAFSGTAHVEVAFNEKITKGVAVTPSKFNIKPTVTGNKFSFTLDQSRKLFIRTNVPEAYSYWGSKNDHHFLVLFADPLEVNPPTLGRAKVVSVLDHGADKSGQNDSAAAINAAIEACPTGGTVYAPAGKYRIDSTVYLDKPDMTLYLEGNAFIQKSNGPDALILAADGVTVSGRGTIEAKSQAMRTEGRRSLRNFKLEDVVLRDSYVSAKGEYHMVARFRLDNFLIRNIKGLGCPQNQTYGKQRDGIALDDTTNGVVDDIFVWSGDDAFYVWSWDRKSENILVKNCAFRAEGGASAMKDMSQGEINNLQFVDCVSLRGALQVDCRIPRGKKPPTPFGRQDHILFKNIDVEEAANIDVAAYFGTQLMDAHCNAKFENVVFKAFYPGKNKFTVRGTDKVNIQFKNLVVKGETIHSREDVKKVGFQDTWEGAAKIGFSAE